MSLRNALLALLTARPLSAYDISKQFERSVGHVWHAPDSQIYPQLRRMREEGLLEANEMPSGGRRTKLEYRITEAGIEQFRAWMDAEHPHQLARDVHRLRAAYFEWAQPDSARAHLRADIAFQQEQIDQWRAIRTGLLSRTDPTLAARLARTAPEDHDRIVAFRVFAYEGLIESAEAEIAWARRGLTLLDELDAAATLPGDRAA